MPVSLPTQTLRPGTRPFETAAVAVIAGVAALAGLVSSAAPTGTAIWDEILKAALVAVVVVAASKAPRWAVIVMASVAAAASFATVWAVAGWLALGIGVGSIILGRRNRLIGAVAAGIAMQAILRLPPAGFFGLQSLLAVAAITPALITGYQYGTKNGRRVARVSVVVAAVATVLMMIFGGLALLNARSDVDNGVAAARRGLNAARSGDTVAVVDELSRAEVSLQSANVQASGLGARLLRLIPVASQHQRAIEEATSAGAVVSRTAAETVVEADIESISLTAGTVDLAALEAMAPKLRATATSLVAAVDAIQATQSPWLIPPLRDRIVDLTDEVQGYLPEIELAADAAESVPTLLGVDRPQTYFIMFGTPAESRELGGFLGSWALLTFDNGQLRLGESGRISDLYRLTRETSVTPGTVSDWFLEMARPSRFPQNLTSSPDFMQVADVSRQVLGGASPEPIDGFVYLDAWALSAMLELTGPVEIPFSDAPLTPETAPAFFFRDQYQDDTGTRDEVFDSLALVANSVLGRLSEQTLPGPAELGRILGPAARAGRLQAVTFDDQHNAFLTSIKLLRDFGPSETTDFVGLIQTNGLPNKMDLYLERELDYQVVVEEDGGLTATATATLRSVVPADASPFTLGAAPETGFNKVLLSLYSPHLLRGVTINGVPADVQSAAEFGLGRYLIEVVLPPTGEPSVVEFALEGTSLPNVPYSLEVWHQPLVNSDEVTVSVSGPDLGVSWAGTLVENLILSAES